MRAIYFVASAITFRGRFRALEKKTREYIGDDSLKNRSILFPLLKKITG